MVCAKVDAFDSMASLRYDVIAAAPCKYHLM